MAYLDATSSGCETISHVYENGRVTTMFCSFGLSLKIMRLFCAGRVVENDNNGFDEQKTNVESDVELTGIRAIILLGIWNVQTAFGLECLLLDKKKCSRVIPKEEKTWSLEAKAQTMIPWIIERRR
ncbi:uncharacterized protein BDR25DRAFT_302795 [Lindgomyces ingoldianus]|uniref:Uncharacterized protein n=1 Tax=Lindgomyces ingoldianus TaxID=673940 RepID=A0ACB6QYH8_9PLEO|nr:uncharacterized protein BDR25DRAFT_302795 [Lindgomyces ingoldianus]KAF2471976.1 hypothetical protein BDR25DRAFT_302795 [Lindgomyces ingoldianus]